MAKMHILNVLTKGSEYPWMSDTYVWQDDAACAFRNPGKFEVDERSDKVAEEKKFASAQEVCGICPVRAECLDGATEDDLRFTMRGGQVPLRHLERTGQRTPSKKPGPGRYNPIVVNEAPDRGPCKQGHNLWAHKKNGSIYCRQCKRDKDNATQRLKKAGERVSAPRKSKMKLGQPCKRGHLDWVLYGKSNGAYCRTCKNGKRRGKF